MILEVMDLVVDHAGSFSPPALHAQLPIQLPARLVEQVGTLFCSRGCWLAVLEVGRRAPEVVHAPPGSAASHRDAGVDQYLPWSPASYQPPLASRE